MEDTDGQGVEREWGRSSPVGREMREGERMCREGVGLGDEGERADSTKGEEGVDPRGGPEALQDGDGGPSEDEGGESVSSSTPVVENDQSSLTLSQKSLLSLSSPTIST